MRQLLAFSINYEIWFAKTEKWLWWKFGWIKLDFDIKQLIRNILAGTWTFSHMRMTDGNHSKFRFVFLLKMFQFSKDMQFLLEWKPTILLFSLRRCKMIEKRFDSTSTHNSWIHCIRARNKQNLLPEKFCYKVFISYRNRQKAQNQCHLLSWVKFSAAWTKFLLKLHTRCVCYRTTKQKST